VITPANNGVISSPLHITGQAKGTWYFEGTFFVKLVDAHGIILAQGPVKSTSNWMTEDFVPFIADLTFASSTTATGTLIFEKDNPSGLPENDASTTVPVRFN
jgi:hypothetical protein